FTWVQKATTLPGGGDSDIAIDAQGTVYVSDLFDSGTNSKLPVSRSTNGATSFAAPVFASPGDVGIVHDRNWIAARGNGIVVVAARAGNVIHSFTSTAVAGLSFGPAVPVATGASIQGPLRYAPNNELWTLYLAGNDLRYAKSTNDGTSWSTGVVAAGENDISLFPVVAIDAANNVYAVWARVTSAVPGGIPPLKTEVRFSKSTDGGATWSPATTLSDPGKTALFPWISAGAAGKVDVIWTEARNDVVGDSGNLGPDLGLPVTHWDVKLSQSLDANKTGSTWTTVVAAPSVHTGSLCTSGLACVGPQNLGIGNLPTPFDRRNLDFYSVATDGQGNAIVAYTKDRPFPGVLVGDLVLSWVDVVVARQTGGTTVA
ncbi:MAG TPA: hypothetical protein VHI93_02875, partial [Candidatus Thermoplasmatota archaeon]|nr:hypothetical protein [Candidatus Thermoplasmatota archaeon]